MKFKMSTKHFYYTKEPDRVIDDIKADHPLAQFYKTVIDYNSIIDLSFMNIGESILVIAIRNRDSFEKQVICNSYRRVE